MDDPDPSLMMPGRLESRARGAVRIQGPGRVEPMRVLPPADEAVPVVPGRNVSLVVGSIQASPLLAAGGSRGSVGPHPKPLRARGSRAGSDASEAISAYHRPMSDAPPEPVDPDRHLSIADGPEVEIRVKGSRFLGRALATGTEEEALGRLARIRRRLHDATHHCWAFRVGSPGECRERFDDDGEPSGSAGPPILGVIHREDRFDTLIVVTRWFGGTKLGVGGLARAYADCAREALGAAPARTIWRTTTLQVDCGFDDVGTVEATIQKAGDAIRRIDRRFDPTPLLRLSILRSRVEPIRAALTEATAGRARLTTPPPPNDGESGAER
ncbi:MAG: hypothetical protein GF346_08335 [Candidatus Eisenbacteria bacterium]|nr:hypothetical protein [Candidatus Latescibacterota bacterium]MBD3302441.1 hypothetical protein [Candidatus Eisenbacteria bacterium]